jgi:hypothetical protein
MYKGSSNMNATRPISHFKPRFAKTTYIYRADWCVSSTWYIAKYVCISVVAAHTILRRDLKMRRKSARWIPHLLTKEKKKLARVRISKQLLKQFPKHSNRSFAKIITGDETWTHYYEPMRKIHNKIWTSKGSQDLA